MCTGFYNLWFLVNKKPGHDFVFQRWQLVVSTDSRGICSILGTPLFLASWRLTDPLQVVTPRHLDPPNVVSTSSVLSSSLNVCCTSTATTCWPWARSLANDQLHSAQPTVVRLQGSAGVLHAVCAAFSPSLKCREAPLTSWSHSIQRESPGHLPQIAGRRVVRQ